MVPDNIQRQQTPNKPDSFKKLKKQTDIKKIPLILN